jgi:hypothetical protein
MYLSLNLTRHELSATLSPVGHSSKSTARCTNTNAPLAVELRTARGPREEHARGWVSQKRVLDTDHVRRDIGAYADNLRQRTAWCANRLDSGAVVTGRGAVDHAVASHKLLDGC